MSASPTPPPVGNQPILVDPATYVWAQTAIIYIAVLLIAVIAIVAFHFWWDHRYPREAKQQRDCKLGGKPGLFLAGDDGYLDFIKASALVHEGGLETKPLEKNGDPWVGFLPREVEMDELSVSEGKSKEDTKLVIDWVARMSRRKLTMRDGKFPVWFGYRGKTVLISLMGLVARDLIDGLAAAMPKLFATVDLLAVKNYFDMPWDQTQRSAQGQRRENIGFKKGLKWNKAEGLKTVAMMFIIGAIILVFAVIVIKVL